MMAVGDGGEDESGDGGIDVSEGRCVDVVKRTCERWLFRAYSTRC